MAAACSTGRLRRSHVIRRRWISRPKQCRRAGTSWEYSQRITPVPYPLRGKSHIRSRVASKVDISHFINDRVAARAFATLGHRKHAIDYVRQRTDGPRAAQITLTQHYFLSSGKTKTVINHIYIERGSVVHAGMEYAFQQNIHCLCRKVK